MRSLKEYIKEREMRQTGGMPESAGFHSKGYHRYFDGYSEYRVKKPNGRTKIERVYTGVYYCQELNFTQRCLLKTLYGTCFGLAVMLFLFCAMRYVPGNACWYVAAAEALSTAGLFWVFCTLASYITTGQTMTMYEYHSAGKLKKATKWTAAALLGVAVMNMLYALLHWQENITGELTGAASSLAAAAACMSICLLEKRVRYSSFLSQNKVPEEAHQIEE